MDESGVNVSRAGWLLVACLGACGRAETPADAVPASPNGEREAAIEASATAAPLGWPAASPRDATGDSAPAPASMAPVDAGTSDGGVDASDAGPRPERCPYRLPPPTVPWSPEPWVPSTITDPVELFNAARSGIQGRWEGLATTPWVGSYRVEITFGADGTYAGRCTEFSRECCNVFYYGTDLDTPLKTYSVEDATLSGNVTGALVLVVHYYDSPPDEFTISSYPGDLSHIEFDATGSRMRFELRRSGKGPILYDLRRLPEAQ